MPRRCSSRASTSTPYCAPNGSVRVGAAAGGFRRGACARRGGAGGAGRDRAPGAYVFDALALRFTRLLVPCECVQRRALVSDLRGPFRALDSPERADAAGSAGRRRDQRVPDTETGGARADELAVDLAAEVIERPAAAVDEDRAKRVGGALHDGGARRAAACLCRGLCAGGRARRVTG